MASLSGSIEKQAVGNAGALELSAIRKEAERPRKRSLKTAELIARQIVADISNKGLKPDDHLPPEAIMVEEYGVGRASVREALRLLEGQGLVQIKAGPGGGPIVGTASPQNLARVFTLFLRLLGVTYEELGDAILILEPHLVEKAANQVKNGAKLEALQNVAEYTVDSLGQYDLSVNGFRDFHRLVVDASGNRVLGLISNSLSVIFAEHLLSSIDTRSFHQTAAQDHLNVAKAILRGHPKAARELMEDHMQRKIAFAREKIPGMFSQPVEWR